MSTLQTYVIVAILTPTDAGILQLQMWMSVLTTYILVTSIVTAAIPWDPTFARVTVSLIYLTRY